MVIHMNAASPDAVDYPELSPPAYSPVPSSEPPAYEVCMSHSLSQSRIISKSSFKPLELKHDICTFQWNRYAIIFDFMIL